ncbi:MAG: diadenylate cyclase CdaA [Oscillospiraceae bacterium]|jgi:diadenylate cyclase|nr:diadenylate cyclase CdaA [Oscillospiraceae bacterium]
MIETIRYIIDQVIGVLTTLSQTFRIWDVIDILVIALLIYSILSFMRRTSASSVIKGLLIVLAVAWISNLLHMNILSYLLRQVLQMGIIVIVILFQPEIRKLFERMGTTKLDSIFRIRGRVEGIEAAVSSVIDACYAMSKMNTGAIIAFERRVGLNDFAVTGVDIDARVTSELLQSIFFENTPLHDGAVIIRGDRLLAAACMLPLSSNYSIGKELGMRHRAGVGLSERSDAVVVMVSEQTGSISVAIDGMLKRNLSNEVFEKLLQNEMLLTEEKRNKKKKTHVKGKV